MLYKVQSCLCLRSAGGMTFESKVLYTLRSVSFRFFLFCVSGFGGGRRLANGRSSYTFYGYALFVQPFAVLCSAADFARSHCKLELAFPFRVAPANCGSGCEMLLTSERFVRLKRKYCIYFLIELLKC